MRIEKDSFVVVESIVQLEDGSFVKGEKGPASMNFVAGYNQVMPALEQRLMGAEAGTELEFVIPAGHAFGEREESLVRTRTFDDFPEGRDLEPGKWVVATNEDMGAQYGYYVAGKGEDSVMLDFNHPLAGKNLHYRLKVCLVRPATREELEYLRPCEQTDEETAPSPVQASLR
ncbi:MAG: peptidylprolyl isomerase [Syntrophobacteraceae bacterium]